MVYLHVDKKVVHRDIKPHNILMKDGIPKISDFGLMRNMKNEGVTACTSTRIYEPPELYDLEKS